MKNAGETILYARRRNVLNRKFHYIASALEDLPDSTVLDGQIVAMDAKGRSDFNLLQNFRSAESKIHYYVFDVLVHKGKLLTQRPLEERRAILSKIVPRNDHVSLSVVDYSAEQMLNTREQCHLPLKGTFLRTSTYTALTRKIAGRDQNVTHCALID